MPKKYAEVQSRVGQPPRPQTSANAAKPPVPTAHARMPMAPLAKRDYAFGGSYKRPGSTTNARSKSSLTTQALANFDDNTAKIVRYDAIEDQPIIA